MAAIVAIAGIVFVVAILRIVMVTPPEKLAAFLRRAGPIGIIAAGAGFTLLSRGAIGLPLAAFGFAAYRRLRLSGPPEREEAGSASNVRSRWLEMTLDHDTGDLDGLVLAGACEGRVLSSLDDDTLKALRLEMAGEADSLRLLEAYLDRRLPGWRTDFEAQPGDGLGGAPRAGPMTEQEAHQILGLEPGATLAEIREAHRRLMKRVHPDHGGTDFLAARINEAKAFLIERHR